MEYDTKGKVLKKAVVWKELYFYQKSDAIYQTLKLVIWIRLVQTLLVKETNSLSLQVKMTSSKYSEILRFIVVMDIQLYALKC